MTRFGYVMTTYVASVSIFALSFVSVAPRLLWNASASVPVGLYRLRPTGKLDVGDLVAVMPPAPLARFLAERHYLPLDTPLMKRVAALPGQEICRVRCTITVDGIELGAVLDRDRHGRALPAWQGCRRVEDGTVFLMNVDAPDSLDSRYFGTLPAATILGQATPLYTDEAGDGRFVWRGSTR